MYLKSFFGKILWQMYGIWLFGHVKFYTSFYVILIDLNVKMILHATSCTNLYSTILINETGMIRKRFIHGIPRKHIIVTEGLFFFAIKRQNIDNTSIKKMASFYSDKSNMTSSFYNFSKQGIWYRVFICIFIEEITTLWRYLSANVGKRFTSVKMTTKCLHYKYVPVWTGIRLTNYTHLHIPELSLPKINFFQAMGQFLSLTVSI